MPSRVQWSPDFSIGNETLDNQHRSLLERCNDLADCVADVDQAGDPGGDQRGDLKFNEVFNDLMALARAHFSTEEELLSRCAYPLLEEHQDERDEFDYLAADIITTENFEKVELQRFLVLWWVGHIMGSGKKYGAFLASNRD